MTIRRRVPLFLLLISIALVAVVAASGLLLLDSFVQLEQREVRLDVERAGYALSDEVADLTDSVLDYADYDRMYAYMLNHDAGFPEGEFGNLDALRVNVVGIFDLEGQMVFGKAVTAPGFRVAAPIPQSLTDYFGASHGLLRRPTVESPVSGVLLLPGGPMLLAVSPILTGDRQGPVRGTLMMGRWLDQQAIDNLSQKTRLSVSLRSIGDPSLAADFKAAKLTLSRSQPIFVRSLGPATIAGYLLVADLQNQPALILKVNLARTIYAQGKVTVLYVVLWILAAGLIFDGAMYLILDRTVLSRLARLSGGVQAIGRLGKISARLDVDGNDELTTLGSTINRTFDDLEDAQESLRRTNSELEGRVKNRTAQLAASKDAAEAASRAKSEFMANISHELRTPMNGIIGMIDMALDTELTSEQSEYLQTAKFSSAAMMTIISDVLDFSKLDSQQLNLRSVEFSVVDCIATVVERLQDSAREKGLTVASEFARRVPRKLVGDPLRVGQILSNLVGNAIKFTERGQVEVRVEIQAESYEQTVLHFSVSDTGMGIPREKQNEIFKCFTQVDMSSTRKHGGLGLGLTISSELVKQMGGRIWVESEMGAGSTFHFTVRLRGAPEAEFVSSRKTSQRLASTEGPGSTMLN